MWEQMRTVTEMHHLDKVNACHGMDECEENAVRHFRNVLERRKRRPLCDSQITASAEKRPKKDTEKGKEGHLTIEYAKAGQTSEPQPEPSTVHIPRKENGNECRLPVVLLENDDASQSSSPPM